MNRDILLNMTAVPLPALVDRRFAKRFDVPLALTALALIAIGLAALYGVEADNGHPYFVKQAVWSLIGMAGLIAAAVVGHERVQRHVRALYVINLILLIAVLVAGHEAKGSVRWFAIGQFRMQPSEFAKLFLTLSLAGLFYSHRERIDRPSTVLRSLAHVAVPILLVLRQPDLGTTLVIGSIWLGMAFVAGVPVKYLAAVIVCALAMFGLMLQAGAIRDYQIKRLLVCFNPGSDPKGAGYQVNQARIAIGSGRIFGKGLGRGTQSQGEFIPERQTDFVFTMIAEEGGFFGSAVTLGLLLTLVLRGWLLVGLASDGVGRLVGAGVLSMISFHALVNMAMNVGLGPVTGVPLPLVSYGGSSILVTLIGIGLIIGIGIRRDPLVF